METVAHSNCRLPHTQNERSSIEMVPKLDVALLGGLADDLLVKSIARLPLHPLFQASTLSKEWHHRFYSASFQHEVHCSSSTSWGSFGPLLVTDKKALLGFDSSSGQLRPLPSLSYLPEGGHEWDLIAECGSLLCLTGIWSDTPIFVTNPLSRSCRVLPPYQDRHSLKMEMQIVCEVESKTYKVFIFSRSLLDPVDLCIFMFDSTNCSWTKTEYSDTSRVRAGAVIFNRVLHKLVVTNSPQSYGRGFHRCYGKISFDLKEKIWKEVSCFHQVFAVKPSQPLFCDFGMSGLFICGSKVILIARQREIISNKDRDLKERTLSVFELDLDKAGDAYLVSTAPMELLNQFPLLCTGGCHNVFAACHGESMYIGGSFPLVVYNVGTPEWFIYSLGSLSTLEYYSGWRWASITYQPGLNPWLKV